MPIYSFTCRTCKNASEQVVRYDERDKQICDIPDCNGSLERAGVELVTLGKSAYQMQAVMGNGEHVRGHFAKSAKMGKR